MATWGFAPHAEVVPKAREAAMKALQLDERLAAPHATLALLDYYFDFDWQTAESRFRRAIELDSSYATAHHWYAEFLAYQARFDEAIAEIDRARRLDPLSLIIATDRGVILTYAHDYDRAIEQFRFALSMDPNFTRARTIVGAYAEEGRYCEEEPSLLIAAKAAATDAVRNDPRFKDILRCIHLEP